MLAGRAAPAHSQPVFQIDTVHFESCDDDILVPVRVFNADNLSRFSMRFDDFDHLSGIQPVPEAAQLLDIGFFLLIADVDGDTTDNCGIRNRLVFMPAFGCDDLGTHIVKFAAFDISGVGRAGDATVTIVSDGVCEGEQATGFSPVEVRVSDAATVLMIENATVSLASVALRSPARHTAVFLPRHRPLSRSIRRRLLRRQTLSVHTPIAREVLELQPVGARSTCLLIRRTLQ